MKYQAIIFDLDGTCLDSDLYVAMNYVELFNKFRPEYTPSLKELVSFSGPPLTEVFSKYFPEYDFETLYEQFSSYAKKYANKYSRLYEDELEVLELIKSSGYKTAIVTSKKKEATRNSLNHFKLDHYMDVVISLDDVKNAKPHPEGLILVAKKLSIDPTNCLYVGDSLSDFKAAQNANMDFALAYWGLKRFTNFEGMKYILNGYKDLKKVLIDEK